MRVEGIDLNAVTGYVKLLPGIHLVEIAEMSEGKAKSSGERKVDVDFTVIEVGINPQMTEEQIKAEQTKVGGRVGMALSLQPKALWKLKQLRDAAAVPAQTGDAFDTDDFIGRRVKIVTSVKSFTDEKGQTTERTQVDDFVSAA